MTKSMKNPIYLVLLFVALLSLTAFAAIPALGVSDLDNNLNDSLNILSYSISGSVESEDLVGSSDENTASESPSAPLESDPSSAPSESEPSSKPVESEKPSFKPIESETSSKQSEASTSYTLSYNANGGIGNMSDPQKYDLNSTVKILANNFKLEGKVFVGWNTKADGTGTAYAPDKTFNIDKNTVLYAQWSDLKMFDLDKSTSNTAVIKLRPGAAINVNAVTTVDSTFTWYLYTKDNKLVKEFPKNPKDEARKSIFAQSHNTEGEFVLVAKATQKGTGGAVGELKWNLSITKSAVPSTGDRIWREGESSDEFTWDYLSFSGFYYNIDTGEGTERMVLKHPGLSSSDRKIREGELVYQTQSVPVDFERSAWGSYDVIGFMADRYFAGYTSNTNFEYEGKDILSEGFILKVLTDENEKHDLRVGQSLNLSDGYKLKVDDINIQGDSARFTILENGKDVGSFVSSSGGTGAFTKRINGEDITTIVVNVDSIFQGTESSTVTIRGVFQLSSKPIVISDGFKSGSMEVTDHGKNNNGRFFIEMENSKDITLSAGNTIKLMDNIEFIVADNNKKLRFAPRVVENNTTKLELRGTVYDADAPASSRVTKWTPYNFEGLAYDIDDDIESTEMLYFDKWDGSRKISDGSLVYKAQAVDVDFSKSAWGSYRVINFMGEKYFAGYTKNSNINAKEVSLLSDGNLSKVLIDNSDKYDLKTGQSLKFEEGYTVKISDINLKGDTVRLELLKNNKSIDSETVSSGSTVTFEKKMGDTDDVSYIALYIDSIFQGAESNTITVRGIFQISDKLTKIEREDSFGKMEVDSSDASSITLKNDDSLTLSAGDSVDFMEVGNTTLSFKVGDSNTLRFYPFTHNNTTKTDKKDTNNLSISLQSSILLGQSATVTVKAGSNYIEDASVYENSTLIGKTDSSGKLTYKPERVGSYNIKAEKDGYNSTTRRVTVREDIGNMSVTLSPSDSIYAETGAKIRVTDEKSGSGISDATVTIEGQTLKTDSNGEVEYTFNNPGTIEISVSKSKYNTEKTSILVNERAAKFVFDEFSINPESPTSYNSLKLMFKVSNEGVEEGKTDVRVVISSEDGEVFNKSKEVSLKPDENTTVEFEFTPKKEGTYVISITEGENSVSVPSEISNISVEKGSSFMYYLKILLIVFLILVFLLIIAFAGLIVYGMSVRGANSQNYKEVASGMAKEYKYKLEKLFKK